MLNTMPNNAYANYRQTSVETATPEKLLLMLYDIGIRALNQGILALEAKDNAKANTYLLKVQEVFLELMNTLDMENSEDIAIQLYQLYHFYDGRVVEANITKDATLLAPVLTFLRDYRAVWVEVARLVKVEKGV